MKNKLFELSVCMLLIGALLLTTGCLLESEEESSDASKLAHLTYYTEQFPPYNYEENGTLKGISIDILESVFEELGKEMPWEKVHLVPWTEGYQAATTQNNTVLFSTVRTSERESLFKWAGPFTNTRIVLFAPITSAITIANPEDLNQYTIGVVHDSVEYSLLINESVSSSNLVNGTTPADLIEMLEEGQIDMWATGDLVGRYQMLMTATNPNAYEIVYNMSQNDLYYAFSKNVPDTLVSTFQDSLNTVKNLKDAYGVSKYERIIYQYLGVGCIRQSFSSETMTALVNTTAAAIENNTSDTFDHINKGETPYWDATDRGLYVFVYNTNVTIVAHAANPYMVNVSYKGKTDVAGKPFRDEIVAGALQNGTGWVEYVYIHPQQPNLYYKEAYYRLTQGSDGANYVVCSANYKLCE